MKLDPTWATLSCLTATEQPLPLCVCVCVCLCICVLWLAVSSMEHLSLGPDCIDRSELFTAHFQKVSAALKLILMFSFFLYNLLQPCCQGSGKYGLLG